MTHQLTLILGGARSGKSSYAEKLAADGGAQVLYVATAEASDEEMAARIARHQSERPAAWQTLEAPLQVGQQIEQVLAKSPADVVLIDCLTLLSSNILLSLGEEPPAAAIEAAVNEEIDALLAARQLAPQSEWIIVSNEVGLGLVPVYPLGRLYRDALGRANQRLAAVADRVLFMVAGLPLVVK